MPTRRSRPALVRRRRSGRARRSTRSARPTCRSFAAASTSTASASTPAMPPRLSERAALAIGQRRRRRSARLRSRLIAVSFPASSSTSETAMNLSLQEPARPRRPHPARPDLRPVRLRQDRRLRRHRRLHRREGPAAADAARGADDPRRARRRPRAGDRLLHAPGGVALAASSRCSPRHLPHLLGRAGKPSRWRSRSTS